MLKPIDAKSCRVALLAGGVSGEREISLASGEGARAALEEAGFPVTMLDPACKEDIKQLIDGNFDVAFICLHGKNGEDGAVQGMLEVLHIPYTGSGVCASALAMDKARAKVFYDLAKIPTPASKVVRLGAAEKSEDIFASMGGKCVVKPIAEGSTLGISIVDSAEELQCSLDQVLEKYGEALVEKFVQGKELTVAVIGNDNPSALPVIEIVPRSGFYDYEAKYTQGGSQHICPARLSSEETVLVQDFAVRVHMALGCAGVSRSDFILEDGGRCWILETNTIPGMTGTSLLPDAAKVAGISFSQLCMQLIELALESFAR